MIRLVGGAGQKFENPVALLVDVAVLDPLNRGELHLGDRAFVHLAGIIFGILERGSRYRKWLALLYVIIRYDHYFGELLLFR